MRLFSYSILFFFFAAFRLTANDSFAVMPDHMALRQVIVSAGSLQLVEEDLGPNPLLKIFHGGKKNRKLVCALLSFPFPFGIVGLHRIYMGTAPYVPVVYIATLGGAFGVLPLIDFFVIVFKKDPELYFGSPRVFMWVN